MRDVLEKAEIRRESKVVSPSIAYCLLRVSSADATVWTCDDYSKFSHLLHKAIGEVGLLANIEIRLLVQLTRLERIRGLMMKGKLASAGSHHSAHLVELHGHRAALSL